MHFRLIEGFLGRLLIAFGGIMVIPLIMAVYLQEPSQNPILISILITFGIGIFMFFHGHTEGKLSIREGFALVASTWIFTSFLGAFPLWFAEVVPTFIDALFESTSGLTATGATLINDLDAVPKSLLLWRSLSHWIGGMGIIVLFIVFLPSIGIGALNLFRAEAPGAIKEKVLPRLRDTAITLWGIYTGLTILEILLLWGFGMSLFDAVNHSFSNMATGGFSTRDASIMYYNSATLETVIIFFIIIAGGNFSLYIEAWRKKSLKVFKDVELKAYLGIILVSTLLITIVLYLSHTPELGLSLRNSLFHVVSINTGTGFITADYDQWPPLAKLILFFLMFAGGMAGSTTGGIKIARLVVLLKICWAELKRTIHPRMTMSIKAGEKSMDPSLFSSVGRFFFLYILVFAIASLFMAGIGLEPFEAMGAVAATLGNVGPAFGIVGPTTTYAAVPLAGKAILTLCMLLGRLELFTILVLVQPEFWRSRKSW